LNKRLLNFEEIYGPDFEAAQRNLFKYFVKSFGCRLVDAGEPVPQDLVDLLPQNGFRTALKITFSVNEDVLLLPNAARDGFIGKAHLLFHRSRSNRSIVNGYSWKENVSWFTAFYWYGVQPEGGLGSTWIADAQHVYLGSFAPLSPEDRDEFLAAPMPSFTLLNTASR
jgi:hypothetical protein